MKFSNDEPTFEPPADFDARLRRELGLPVASADEIGDRPVDLVELDSTEETTPDESAPRPFDARLLAAAAAVAVAVVIAAVVLLARAPDTSTTDVATTEPCVTVATLLADFDASPDRETLSPLRAFVDELLDEWSRDGSVAATDLQRLELAQDSLSEAERLVGDAEASRALAAARRAADHLGEIEALELRVTDRGPECDD